jgi:hypothetical protein
MKRKHIKIEDVQIGLNSAGGFCYDTGEVLEDGDLVYSITIPTAIDEDTFYFKSKRAANKYIKDNELE